MRLGESGFALYRFAVAFDRLVGPAEFVQGDTEIVMVLDESRIRFPARGRSW